MSVPTELMEEPGTRTLLGLRLGLWGSVVCLAAAGALSAYGWTHTSAGARIAVHFDSAGRANRYAGKFSAFVVLPLVMVGVSLLFAAFSRLDPRRRNIAQSARAFDAIWLAVLVLLLVVHAQLVRVAVGHHGSVDSGITYLVVGGMFVVMGNYLPKLKSSWFVGIRTPWTLSDERTWARTHRLGGPLLMALGTGIAVVGLTTDKVVTSICLGAGVAAYVLGLSAYSYWISPSRLRHPR